MTADEAAKPGPSRRGLLAGAGVLGLLAGAGAAWWRLHRAGNAAPTDAAAFWRQTYPTPKGEPLAMASLAGRPLLLNFWATWCPPCVEEMPLLDAFFREQSPNGWQLLGLAVDQLAPVQSFLARRPVAFPVVLAGPEGAQLSRDLGNLAGGLPFSVVFGADGQVRHRRMGRVSADDLQQWAALR